MSETLFGDGPLQFGLFDWIEWDQAPASDIFEQRLQMLEYADQAGFSVTTSPSTMGRR